jgi:ParB family chromosome partitioning protein
MKTALGKGLKALIPETSEGVQEIPLDRIVTNPKQPRRVFEESTLEELANSIREKGVLQPVIVKKAEDDRYILVAGERRLRAARLAGLKTIPAIVKEATEAEAVEIALIENIQRDDLNPLEMAEAFQRLIDEFGYTQEQLATRIGKDRATVANYLRILKLPPDIKEYILSGQISLGHAKAILSLPTKTSQIEVARQVLRRGLSVRQTERLCKALSKKPPKASKKEKDPNIAALEERLKRSLGTKVTLKHRGGKGKIEIEYYSLDELDRLIELLTA